MKTIAPSGSIRRNEMCFPAKSSQAKSDFSTKNAWFSSQPETSTRQHSDCVKVSASIIIRTPAELKAVGSPAERIQPIARKRVSEFGEKEESNDVREGDQSRGLCAALSQMPSTRSCLFECPVDSDWKY
jgi:hypothetical protein